MATQSIKQYWVRKAVDGNKIQRYWSLKVNMWDKMRNWNGPDCYADLDAMLFKDDYFKIDDNIRLLEALNGPNGYTIYKAILAKGD